MERLLNENEICNNLCDDIISVQGNINVNSGCSPS
jgi:hypothetical protein